MPQPAQAAVPAWTLYRSRISYFSGKLEAYLQYKGLDFRRVEVDMDVLRRIYKATGVMKMPALEAADGRWLFDTTPTIAWLEQELGGVPVLPDDPALAFVALLIEDYGDEWLWRPAMWWRWVPRHSRRLLGAIIASEIIHHRFAGPLGWGFAQRQLREWVYGDGVDRRNEGPVRDMYLRELEFLEALLATQPFLLGDRPSVADYGYFGSMFRHFNHDPDPAEVMRMTARRTLAWVGRVWCARQDPSAGAPRWNWPDAALWRPLLDRIANDYLPYLQQNAAAFTARRRRFDFRGKSLAFRRTKTTDYRVWCLEVLQRQYRALAKQPRSRVDALFAAVGGLGILADGAQIDSGMDAFYRLPVPAQASARTRLDPRKLLLGQARN